MGRSPGNRKPLLRRLLQPLLDRRRQRRRARFTRSVHRRGERFACRALAGQSDYNLSINCDMTVSCNCQDNDPAALLGNLRSNDLASMLDGARAREMRQTLAQGQLPVDTCLGCADLLTMPADQAAAQAAQWDLPRRGIMVESTVRCNLHCVSCPRSSLTGSRAQQQLSLDDIRIIAAEIRRHRITTLSYFKLGEPFLSPTVLEELTELRRDNPDLQIVISTNGMAVATERQRQAALLADLLYFSIDGINDRMVQRYQRGGSFERSYRNMQELVRYRDQQGRQGPLIEWKYVLFRWNDHRRTINRAVALARQAGVDTISFWPATIPITGRSWRYRLGGHIRRIGEASWKGRELRFTTEQRENSEDS